MGNKITSKEPMDISQWAPIIEASDLSLEEKISWHIAILFKRPDAQKLVPWFTEVVRWVRLGYDLDTQFKSPIAPPAGTPEPTAFQIIEAFKLEAYC